MPAVTTIVSPGRASRRAAVTVVTGPSGATTIRCAGGAGSVARAASARASATLPTEPSRGKLLPDDAAGAQGVHATTDSWRAIAAGARIFARRHSSTATVTT